MWDFLKKSPQKPIFKVSNFHLLTAYTIFFANHSKISSRIQTISQGNDGDGDSGSSDPLDFKIELREHLPDGLKKVVGSLKAYNQRSRAKLHLVATSGVVVNNVDISGTAKRHLVFE